MNRKIEEIIEGYRDEMVVKLQELIRIESVADCATDSSEEAPFGQGPLKALRYMMQLGKDKGFKCINYDNKVCQLDFGDEKPDAVGIASHVDVVPAEGAWKFPPYGAEIHEGRIYGRGAVDDKGPAIAAFYAALAIKESGLPLSRSITQIIGTYEEGGSFPCIRHYLDKAERIPSQGIVPDSFFPVCFSEKHFVNLRLTANSDAVSGGRRLLKSIRGGEAINVVPSYAEAVFSDEKGKPVETVLAEGITAHASTPRQGKNAIAGLISRLSEQEFEPYNIYTAVKELRDIMGCDTDGRGLGLYCSDETGETTSNLGLISYKDGTLTAEANIRLPLSITFQDMRERLEKCFEHRELDFEVSHFLEGFYTDVKRPPAKILMDVYRELTGDVRSQPFANGSGSYARIMKDFIPFGIAMQDEPLQFHVEDEHISIERLVQVAKIYGEALYRLSV